MVLSQGIFRLDKFIIINYIAILYLEIKFKKKLTK